MSTHSDDLDTVHRLARVEALPDRIGRYEVMALLGQGGMGKVYRANDPQLSRKVAIKILLEGTPENQQKMLLKEAKLVAQLRHPNIVTVYEVVTETPQPYVVMEYIEGRPLSRYLRETRPSLRWTLELLHKVALAIHHAHKEGILHRDLKPGNIMLDINQEPKVMDFGLAKQMNADSSGSSYGMVIGTPSYIPPEQMNGLLDRIDPRSDVYALGATLYEMLTGRAPFLGDNIMDIALGVLEKIPTPLTDLVPSIPKEVEMICLKCLEKNPKKRYQSAYALAQDIKRYLSAQPIAIFPKSPFYRLHKWLQRHMRKEGLGMAALVVALLGSLVLNTFFAWRFHSAPTTSVSPRIQKPENNTPQQPVVPSAPSTEAMLRPQPVQGSAEFLAMLLQGIDKAIAEHQPASEVEKQFASLEKLVGETAWLQRQWGAFYLAYARREQECGRHQGLYRQALQHLEQAVALSPQDYHTCFLAYQICQKYPGSFWQEKSRHYAKLLQEGIAEYRYYLEALPQLEILVEQKSNEERDGIWQRALVLCDKAIASNATFAHAHALKAKFFEKLTQYHDALAQCQLALDICAASKEDGSNEQPPHPGLSDFLTVQGDIYRQQYRTDPTKALSAYDQAVAVDITNWRALCNRGQCYRDLGQYAKALEDFTRVVAILPQEPIGYLARIDTYLKIPQYTQAQEDCRMLLKIAPDSYLSYVAMANIHQALAQYPQALEAITRALSLHAQEAKLYLMRANLYSMLKQNDKAYQDIQKAIQMHGK